MMVLRIANRCQTLAIAVPNNLRPASDNFFSVEKVYTTHWVTALSSNRTVSYRSIHRNVFIPNILHYAVLCFVKTKQNTTLLYLIMWLGIWTRLPLGILRQLSFHGYISCSISTKITLFLAAGLHMWSRQRIYDLGLVCSYLHHSYPWCIVEWEKKLAISFNYFRLLCLTREDCNLLMSVHFGGAIRVWWSNLVFFFPCCCLISLTPPSREGTGHSIDALKGPVEVLCCYRNHSQLPLQAR